MARIEQHGGRERLPVDALTISGLIRLRHRYGHELFRDEIQAIESHYTDLSNRRYPVRINNLPGAVVQQLSRVGLPFAPSIPSAGGDGAIDAPPTLIRTIVDYAWGQANELHQGGLATEDFVRRLERRIDELRKE